ncbi:7-cyano-7-deazaguanine synthase (plasmid) [Cereibacter azotoformans]|uniref:7-cyano-7-deazaguanine synthase n=1 Tax=Cereibacter azotoformans TaxID=43057 RepID=UPI003B221498
MAFWKRPEITITIDYGQRAAEAEVTAARQVASELGIRHEVIAINCTPIGSGDMSGNDALKIAPVPEWWPFRNQLLLTFAAARGLVLEVTEIMTGSVASDGSHADGRPGFYRAMDAVTSFQEGGIRVTAPALHMTTSELVRQSGVPRDILAWAHSCHTGNLACGHCRGCLKHYQVTKDVYGVAY